MVRVHAVPHMFSDDGTTWQLNTTQAFGKGCGSFIRAGQRDWDLSPFLSLLLSLPPSSPLALCSSGDWGLLGSREGGRRERETSFS